MAGIDSYVQLMLHCDGTNGSTTFTDSSQNNSTQTHTGNVQISTTKQEFGTASLYNYASGSTSAYVTAPFISAFELGSTDFTIDCWAYITNNSTTNILYGRTTNGSSYLYWQITTGNNGIRFADYNSGYVQNAYWTCTLDSSPNWHHFAIERYNGTFYFYYDGVKQTVGSSNSTNSNALTTRSVGLDISGSSFNGNYYLHSGYLDEFRYSVGIARYQGTNFTPPTSAYSSATVVTAASVPVSSAVAVPIISASYNTSLSGTSLASSLISPSWSATCNVNSPSASLISSLTSPTIECDCFIIPSITSLTSGVITPSIIASCDAIPSSISLISSLNSPQTIEGTVITPATISCASSINVPGIVIDYSIISPSISLISSINNPSSSIVTEVTASSISLSSNVSTPLVLPTVNIIPTSITVSTSISSPNLNISQTLIPSGLSLNSALTTPNTISSYTASNYAVKIISYNPLVIVNNTNPVQITIVNTTTPDTPSYLTYVYPGVSYPTDVIYNSVLGYLYIACSDGNILKINTSNYLSYSILNTGASGNLTSLAVLPNNFDIFAGSDYSSGEVVSMYEGSSIILNTDIRYLVQINTILNTKINTINATLLNSDIRFSAIVNNILNTDIRFINTDFENISLSPISRTDFHVYVDGIELTDVKLDSISIRHNADDKSSASFQLARKHDNFDYTLGGVHSQISNQNHLQIYIQGHLEFDGYIWNVDCKSENETVKITGYTILPQVDDRSNVTLSIPGINDKLHVYHALIHDPDIDNPYIPPGDPTPPFYLGIQIDPGYQKTQNVMQYEGKTIAGQSDTQKVNYVFGNGDSGAYDQNQNSQYFTPFQNWTYFWFASATDFTTGLNFYGLMPGSLAYLGTSPSSLTSKSWTVNGINWWYQRERPDTIRRLGTGTLYETDLLGIPGIHFDHYPSPNEVYSTFTGDDVWTAKEQLIIKSQSGNPEVGQLVVRNGNVLNSETGDALTFGDWKILPTLSTTIIDLMDSKLGVFWGSAPYKKVSCKSGIFTPRTKWEDQTDGLYYHTAEGYDYTDYVNQVGELEFQKLQNINGTVLPKTKADIDLFLDGYYHYNIAVLKRINIDNTTQTNIYNNQNGFPVSVKSIEIDSSSMKVKLTCDNQWSRLELLEIESNMPDPNKYLTPETMKFVTAKVDPNQLSSGQLFTS